MASLAGFVWLWVNTGGDVATKVILVGMLGVLWIGIVSAVIGVIALLLGMVGLVVHPFRRR